MISQDFLNIKLWLTMLGIFSCGYLIFIYLLWWSVCSYVLPIFKVGLFNFWLSWSVLYIFWTQILYQIYDIKIFPVACHFILLIVFRWTDVFNFEEIKIINLFFVDCFCCNILRNLCLAQFCKDFLLLFL